MPKQKSWRKKGFKIPQNANSWDKKWFAQSEKNAEKLKHRRERYNAAEGNIIGFVRTIEGLKKDFKLDLTRIIDPLTLQKLTPGPIQILDSGAGHGFISAGLLARFGKKVKVTALGWEELPPAKKIKQTIDAELKLIGKKTDPWNQASNDVLKRAISFLPTYTKMRRKIKQAKVFFENYSPGKQYDIIVDVTGPAWHTGFHTRTLEQIFNLLKPNGTAILSRYALITKQAFELGNPNGKYARETGYYLVLDRKITQFDVYKKVRVTKKSRPVKRNPKYPGTWAFRSN